MDEVETDWTNIDWYRNTHTDDLFGVVVTQMEDTLEGLRVLYKRLRDEGVNPDKKAMLQIKNAALTLKTALSMLKKY